MTSIDKDPQAKLDYHIDWTDYLTPLADTLANVTFTVSGSGTLVSSSVQGKVATAWVGGGTVGETLILTCHIVTVGGRTDERSVFIKIKDNLGWHCADEPTGAGAHATLTNTAKRVANPVWEPAMTLDFDLYDVYRITAGGDTALTISGGADGQQCQIEYTQDSTGARLIAWPGNVRFSTDLPAPLLSIGTGKMDRIGFQANTGLNRYDCVAVVKGY